MSLTEDHSMHPSPEELPSLNFAAWEQMEALLDELPGYSIPPGLEDPDTDPQTGFPRRDEADILWESATEEAPFTITSPEELTPHQVLKKYWGYDSFRPMQEEIIESILAGKDTLGLLPTGGGKSITFQVPGLIRQGVTIVVSPLIALMKDQVDHLQRRRIKAATIHSGMSIREVDKIIDNVIYGGYKFLYISPERIASPLFQEALLALKVSFIVVDECHCISQWGYDFRPSYLNIHTIRELLPGIPILALTATATPYVITDIMRQLHFGVPNVLSTSFLRSNLAYVVRRTEAKAEMLLHVLSHVPGSAIVYCRNRKKTREIAQMLQKAGVAADFFHAGLTHAERELKQNSWMHNDLRVMVCTNAFGMGIDKPDVRLVVHWTMPNSIEEYFQEAGRAGRDQEKAYAVALIDHTEIGLLKRRLEDEFPPKEFMRKVYDAICSFLRIGMGEGYQKSYTFDIPLFIRRHHLHPTRTLSAIKLWELCNIWELHTEESRSQVVMECTREELYRQRKMPLNSENVLNALMRSYGGIFADYCIIDEANLAALCHLSRQEVYDALTELSKMHLLHYIPRKKMPRLLFKARREEGKHLIIPRNVYEERKQAFSQRIAAVIHYIQNNHTCRSRTLLSYFGETNSAPCGLCDVCLNIVTPNLRQHTLVRVNEFLDQHNWAQSKTLTLRQTSQALAIDKTTLLTALEYLCSNSNKYRTDGLTIQRI